MITGNAFLHADQSLLDALARMTRSIRGREAIYIALSRLRPRNRTPIRVRIAAQLFAPLVAGHGCEIYILSNGDLVVLGTDMPPSALEVQGERLRALFRSDPGSAGEGPDGNDAFLTLYDLQRDRESLRLRVEELGRDHVEMIESQREAAQSERDKDEPLAPGHLRHIARALGNLDPQPLVQRQAVLRIDEDRHGRFHYEEYYVAMAEVRQACAPNVDLFANRWLFQDVCRELDPRIVAAITQLPLPKPPIGVGLNLNLETVLSPTMERLHTALPKGSRMTVEVQVIDAFTNLDRLGQANAWLSARGHSLVLDGVSARALAMIDPARLDVGGLKLTWDPDLADPAAIWEGPHPKALIRMLGLDRIILARVENETALTWGMAQGIRSFQGFFVDRVIGATTMAGCPKREMCTLAQCVERRRSAAGPTRRACPNPPHLDSVTRLHNLAGGLGGRSASGTPAAPQGGVHG